MQRFVLLVLLVTTLQLNGCAFVNVAVTPQLQPLEERVIEGEGRAKLLVLDITGFISEKERSGNQLMAARPSTVAQVKEALQKAEKDEAVAGVILRINSPGGTVTASDIIYHELQTFRQRRKVPVAACITGIGTSGGYYVAAAADEISAHPTAITGSIGVIVLKLNVEGLLAKIGVSGQAIKSGAKKDIMSPLRTSTPEEQQIMQTIIDRLYQRFVEVVLARTGNRLDRKELDTIADGRIYTAEQAQSLKLVDRIGYLDDAITAMKQKLGLDRARIVSYYRPGGYRGTIYSAPSGDTGQVVNLININADSLELVPSAEFMYLWQQ